MTSTCPMHPKGEQDTGIEELKLRFWISLVCTLILMFLKTSGIIYAAIQALITTGIVFWAGKVLLKHGLQSVAKRKLNMFTLILLGIGASYIYSLGATCYLFFLFLQNVLHEMPLYFESAAAITTLTLLGQLLEKQAENKTTLALHKLLDLTPKMARLVEKDQEIDVPLNQVQIGDLLRVRPGEKVPTDGIVVEGTGSINASMITGEPLPVLKQEGDSVIGATINEQGSFILKVEKIGAETLLARIIEAVQKAQNTQMPIQKMVDRICVYFVPIVIFIALCTFLLWSFLYPSSTYLEAMMSAISVLIIACPCAMGLATPIALTVSIGQAATEGILIKDARALENLCKADTFVFDKTGTLTEGKPHIVAQFSLPPFNDKETLLLAASLELASTHPLALAFLSKATENKLSLKPVKHFQNSIGEGVIGEIEGKQVSLGNEHLLSDAQKSELSKTWPSLPREETGYTALYLIVDGSLACRFAICDPIKKEAREVLEKLHKEHKKIFLVTGDHCPAAQYLGKSLPIDLIKADVFPLQKQTIVHDLKKTGKIVAMIGDGINDAPALAQADIGIAMGQGSDIAIETSDITLMRGDLHLLLRAKELSLSTITTIRQNLFFAFLYNILAIAVAAGVLYPIFHVTMNPMIASMAMVLSSLSVTLNSLRLQKRPSHYTISMRSMICIALGGLLLIGSHLYREQEKKSPPAESLEESLERLLPYGESIERIDPLKGGFANSIWDVYTKKNHYILREKRKTVSSCSFMRDLKIAQKAFTYRMGPKVIGANTKRQQILLEYIQHVPWPFYKKNFKPYQDTMKLLRSFHDQMPIHTPIGKKAIYAPFYSLFNMRNSLLDSSEHIPSQFFIAAKKMEEIFQNIHPWLQKHARLCHGDFCKDNVLLSEKLTPTLIDFDSAFLGDPFFDIIKFSATLPLEKRLELFKTYLGDKQPTLQQLCHFKLMDLTFLMVIATLRFQSAQISPSPEERLSKADMEEILKNGDNLPSWFEVPFGNNSPKMKQTAALYALAEFLRRMPELELLISSFEDPVHIAE